MPFPPPNYNIFTPEIEEKTMEVREERKGIPASCLRMHKFKFLPSSCSLRGGDKKESMNHKEHVCLEIVSSFLSFWR
jgi:hypothetical protein